jgi:hypothetical protein
MIEGVRVARIKRRDRDERVDAEQHATADHAVDDYPNEAFHQHDSIWRALPPWRAAIASPE